MKKENIITKEILNYYRKYPEKLDAISDKYHFQAFYLRMLFALGIVLTVGSRIISYYYQESWGRFVDEVVLDVCSELGIAIFGGAITAYFLESIQKKEYQRNLKMQREIKQKLAEEE